MRLFWVYARQMPVLHARESIHRVNELSFAFGAMSKEDSAKFIGDLQGLATRNIAREYVEAAEDHPPRPTSLEQMHHLLGQSGSSIA